jgi:DMSO/TMAO reductase YedYZ molybdopterin-dependent catalytic subunit
MERDMTDTDAATGGWRAPAANGGTPGAAEALVVIRQEPLNAETPLSALGVTPTPLDLFYIRNNYPVPALTADTWRLEVGGAVVHPFTLTLADLLALPSRTFAATMECAGNDRTGFAPLPSGEPWGAGAVSTGVWRGTALAPLLERAGLRADVVEILFAGVDTPPGEAPPFVRSLPRAVALDPDVLLAYELNGEPLAPEHGWPVRLLVPGWYGVASVKWLGRIEALTTPFTGYFQAARYVMDVPGAATRPPLRTMQVKSLITHPRDGASVPPGTQSVRGVAWSGDGAISEVAVSTDGGLTWQPAQVTPPASPYAWQPWAFAWTPAGPGPVTLCARATDATGRTQPAVALWNRLGYVNNAIQAVTVDVMRDA